MMDASYVKEMERLANEGIIIDHEGKKYSARSFKPIFYQPRPEALKVKTLTSIPSYLDMNVDSLKRPDLLIHVESHDRVVLYSVLNGEDRKRDCFLVAEADGARFQFGQWMSPESFIIGLNSLFIQNEDRDHILNYVSKLKIEDEANIVDDGITQSAQVRVGIKGNLTETQAAPNKVGLVPYRTFREIEQPSSFFIFRMRREGSDVKLSLHEADGGAWKQTAMDWIVGWIQKNINDVAVVS